ncbi:HepT-like ribonuclease domain-containing protein [Salinibacterium hongtaonis]|uniref:DUF86 domain-containing protein n=1 Tax=Homoserinimonas hongtaonis TaxID=2079791 RepID=A0A2U1SZR7_9MICO|nr:HepT-like ribonuclease domain-containing protein [Salinibacterium hongtaonis]PWB97124.1 hypothetical protein DF220_04180 [Salinibacterium hongtaonis]
MTLLPADRTARWLDDLDSALEAAATLAARGETAFQSDAALPLAFEALSNRVGDLCKRLVAADPVRFTEPIWSQAARNRDFVVHHYDRLDSAALWVTVTRSFPELREAVQTQRRT